MDFTTAIKGVCISIDPAKTFSWISEGDVRKKQDNLKTFTKVFTIDPWTWTNFGLDQTPFWQMSLNNLFFSDVTPKVLFVYWRKSIKLKHRITMLGALLLSVAYTCINFVFQFNMFLSNINLYFLILLYLMNNYE